jgi:cell division protein FtsA
MHPLLQHPHQILGLLDVGTAKIACVMLQHEAQGTLRVIGLGHQRARGLKASVIIDADAAEDSVRAAVSQAEQMAGIRLEDVVMSATCGRLTSNHLAAALDLGGRPITPSDIEKLLDAGRTHAEQEDRAPLHLEALGARLDGHPVAGPVVGRHGERLALDVHLISADRAPLRHLIHVAERCHLRVLALAPAPLASSLAVTTPDERAEGVIVLDCGAGTTGLSLFSGGLCVGLHVVQVGGNHLTYDLTRALSVPLNEAERIKKNYDIEGFAHAATEPRSAFQDATTVLPAIGVHAISKSAISKQVTRAAITDILTSRVDALLLQIMQRIQRAGIPLHNLRHVAMTGGGSLLPLLARRAATVLGRPVRLAAPQQLGGWPQALLQPAFATVAGLQHFALNPTLGLRLAVVPSQSGAEVWRRQSV